MNTDKSVQTYAPYVTDLIVVYSSNVWRVIDR